MFTEYSRVNIPGLQVTTLSQPSNSNYIWIHYFRISESAEYFPLPFMSVARERPIISK